jgi:hypothetical protein
VAAAAASAAAHDAPPLLTCRVWAFSAPPNEIKTAQVAASWVNQAANMFSDLLSPPRR